MSAAPIAPAPSRTPDFREPGSAPRWRVGVGAVVVAVLVLVGIGVVLSAVASAHEAVSPVLSSARATASPAPTPTTVTASGGARAGGVFVHVLGRVERPGLYEVDAGARAVDVVAAAGGFAAEADQSSLNLARPVSDGEQIVIPAVGEAAASAASGTAGLAQAGAGGSASAVGSSSAAATAAPVDLNSADQTALEAISGVGPATATAILAWRQEHGAFQAVEDLLDVTGIGEKKLAALRDFVTVR